MYPTLSYLLKYLTGLTLPIPIPTFGFFMCAGFVAAYYLFKSEFKRKEKQGILSEITVSDRGKNHVAQGLFLKAILPFIIGYKLVYLVSHFSIFTANPQAVLLSTDGNCAGGLVAAAATIALAVYRRKNSSVSSENPVVKTRLIHPYELNDTLLFWCGVGGFTGTVLLAKLDYIPEIIADPGRRLFAYDGMVFYGALIGGAVGYFSILFKHKIKFLVGADVGSPGMMAAYCIGRLGCHLSGDGDWGIVNSFTKPTWLNWLPETWWKNDYPHNVIHQGLLLNNCYDNFCNVLPAPVFPTSLYEFFMCLLLFVFMWSIRNKLSKTGMMFFIYIAALGTERYFIEFIRINPKFCFLNVCLSQAQWISILFVIAGLAGLTTLILQSRNINPNTKKI